MRLIPLLLENAFSLPPPLSLWVISTSRTIRGRSRASFVVPAMPLLRGAGTRWIQRLVCLAACALVADSATYSPHEVASARPRALRQPYELFVETLRLPALGYCLRPVLTRRAAHAVWSARRIVLWYNA